MKKCSHYHSMYFMAFNTCPCTEQDFKDTFNFCLSLQSLAAPQLEERAGRGEELAHHFRQRPQLTAQRSGSVPLLRFQASEQPLTPRGDAQISSHLSELLAHTAGLAGDPCLLSRILPSGTATTFSFLTSKPSWERSAPQGAPLAPSLWL